MKIGSSELMGEETLASTSVSERANDTPPLYSVMNGTHFVQVGPVSAKKMDPDITLAKSHHGWSLSNDACTSCALGILGLTATAFVWVLLFA